MCFQQSMHRILTAVQILNSPTALKLATDRLFFGALLIQRTVNHNKNKRHTEFSLFIRIDVLLKIIYSEKIRDINSIVSEFFIMYILDLPDCIQYLEYCSYNEIAKQCIVSIKSNTTLNFNLPREKN